MNRPDIHSGRLSAEEYCRNFADIKPALSNYEAHIEANRCLYCEAAPCIPACPTGINIPSFINRIATNNLDGAAQAILDANILGGSCARVCPTEILCEQACVRNHAPECKAVTIGRLQRYAIDNRQAHNHPFTRLPDTGKTIAVFLGLGLGGCNTMDLEGEQVAGVEDALSAISRLRQSNDLSQLPVGKRIVVIGGGNTAIDIACQCKRLGAEEVTIAYRRGSQQMSATQHEQAFARDNGVRILSWVQPSSLLTEDGRVTGINLEKTTLDINDNLQGTGEITTIPIDTLYKAIGQYFLADCFANANESPELNGNRIATDKNFRTSLSNVWAGGDCIDRDPDLTVHAVEHGKQAAHAIHQYLQRDTENG